MLFSSGSQSALAHTNAQVQPAQIPSNNPTSSVTSNPSQAGGQAARFQSLLGKRTFQGDRQVRQGLVLAAVNVTGKNPEEGLQELQNGQSITEIVQSWGKTSADVLEIYNQTGNTC